jgi:hypothetical protein
MPGRRSRIVNELVAMVLDDSRGGDPSEAARRLSTQIPERTARTLAADYLAALARGEIRDRTLAEERAAMRAELIDELAPPPAAGHREPQTVPPPTAEQQEQWARAAAEQEARWAEEDAEREARLNRNLLDALQQYTDTIRAEWTRELLGSTFALPDGSMVTWGAATVAQHTQRIDMFTRNARHEEAVRQLQASDASCLAELIGAV